MTIRCREALLLREGLQGTEHLPVVRALFRAAAREHQAPTLNPLEIALAGIKWRPETQTTPPVGS